jgi:hypothetical protein
MEVSDQHDILAIYLQWRRPGTHWIGGGDGFQSWVRYFCEEKIPVARGMKP